MSTLKASLWSQKEFTPPSSSLPKRNKGNLPGFVIAQSLQNGYQKTKGKFEMDTRHFKPMDVGHWKFSKLNTGNDSVFPFNSKYAMSVLDHHCCTVCLFVSYLYITKNPLYFSMSLIKWDLSTQRHFHLWRSTRGGRNISEPANHAEKKNK